MASNPIPDFPDFPDSHIRHCLYFEFSKGSSPQQAAKNINETYGQGTTNAKTCSSWFARFRSGDTSMNEEPLSSRPVQSSVEEILRLLNSDSRISSRKIASQLGVPHETVLRNLRELGYKAKKGQWTPEPQRKKGNIATRRTTNKNI